ncbi:hypothetical protein [Rhizobium laguerreae]|uniref:hypothetical protein n=1 Tax=Rhizobium laguerreae TaxID=1076926 RepID=UPI001C91334F|nr:hypothetical protein [Rhizobium laguerreae]MBY3493872.1 hypothetical protein [Rhizobium laguerreae]
MNGSLLPIEVYDFVRSLRTGPRKCSDDELAGELFDRGLAEVGENGKLQLTELGWSVKRVLKAA